MFQSSKFVTEKKSRQLIEKLTAFKNKDKAVYFKKLFGIYDGKEEMVTLLCENHMANIIVDRFGRNVHMRPVDE